MEKLQAQIFKENSKNRVDFDVNKFLTKVQEKGIVVFWERMAICPCRKEISAQPVHNCINCNGFGYYWFDKQEIKAMVSGASLSRNFLQWSEVLEGSIYMSIDPFYRIGWYDRFTIKDAESVFSEVKEIEIDDDDNFFIKTIYNTKEIINCFKYVNETTALLEFIESEYEIDALDSKKIILNKTGLQEGQSVSILYQYNPVYLVIDSLNDYRNTYVKNKKEIEVLEKAPLRFLAKRMHLVLT